jgi:hypothetical protein
MKGLLLVAMEPPAPLEEEFNDWYDTEHFPQRRALPGFENATRWVCLQGWPRYVALYDLTSVDALATPEYRAVSGPNSTPWSRRVLPRTIGRTRVVAEQIAPGDALTTDPALTAQLVLARYGQPIDATMTSPDLPGLLQQRLFRTAAGQTYLLAAFDRPLTATRLQETYAAIGTIGALQFNIYTPYHRG